MPFLAGGLLPGGWADAKLNTHRTVSEGDEQAME